MNAFPKSTLVQVTEDVTSCYDVIIQLYSFVKPILDLNEKRMIAIISRYRWTNNISDNFYYND